MYDPATGVTFDGVSADGTVNQQLRRRVDHPRAAHDAGARRGPGPGRARARGRAGPHRDGQRTVEAESATLTGGAKVVTPDSPWTGESQWSGGAYVRRRRRRPAHLDAAGPGHAAPAGRAGREPGAGRDGPRGVRRRETPRSGRCASAPSARRASRPAPGALLPVALPSELPAGATALTADVSGGTGDLDAVLLTPLVSQLVTSGGGHAVALLTSVAGTPRTGTVTVPGAGRCG